MKTNDAQCRNYSLFSKFCWRKLDNDSSKIRLEPYLTPLTKQINLK